jgi:hypothetical protein
VDHRTVQSELRIQESYLDSGFHIDNFVILVADSTVGVASNTFLGPCSVLRWVRCRNVSVLNDALLKLFCFLRIQSLIYTDRCWLIRAYLLISGTSVCSFQKEAPRAVCHDFFFLRCLFSALAHLDIDYRCDNRRFWLSAHNCQVSIPTSQNLKLKQQIWIFRAD